MLPMSHDKLMIIVKSQVLMRVGLLALDLDIFRKYIRCHVNVEHKS